MPTVTMPQLGESVAEGTIGKWLKQVGDSVELGEPIVEVVTDKVNAEVPSPFAGTLTQILVGEGQTVPNDASIAVIEASGSTTAPTPPAATSPASAPVTTGAPAAVTTSASLIAVPVAPRPVAAPSAPAVAVSEYRGRMTPAVRRLAREHSVDLGRVPGTGFGGRVTRDDVLGYVAANGNGSAAAAAANGNGSAADAAATDASAPATPAPPAAAPAGPSADYLKPLTKIRRAIAAQMTRAAAVPTAYETVEVDMSSVVRLRDQRKREYAEREGMGLSYVAFVTKAAVEALRRNPDLNGHYTDEGHWVRRDINIGVAVAVDDGLMVPVIGGADQLSIHGLNRAVNDLAARARIGKLKVNEVSGGTFTVDNTGWAGSILTMPIINVPEIAILTMEAIVKKPVVVETAGGDSIAIRPMMAMVLGFDHRATDGAQAGRFLTDVKRWLESVDDSTPVW